MNTVYCVFAESGTLEVIFKSKKKMNDYLKDNEKRKLTSESWGFWGK